MATIQQIEANRRNAQRSTKPHPPAEPKPSAGTPTRTAPSARRISSNDWKGGCAAASPLKEGERKRRLPDCKPVSVPLRVTVIPLDRTLLYGSSDLPGSPTGRAAPSPLFGLAPRGVFPAGGITPAAVRSYRTISPLPPVSGRRYIFCGTFRKASRPSRPLAGTPPCGDRTFLSRCRKRLSVRQPHLPIVAFRRPKLAAPRTGIIETCESLPSSFWPCALPAATAAPKTGRPCARASSITLRMPSSA